MSVIKTRFWTAFAALWIWAGSPADLGFAREAAVHGHEAHWSYEGETGPDRWGDLKGEFELCKKGKGQSPVDLAGGAESRLDSLEFAYKDSPLRIVNNGHTVQVNYEPGSSVKIGGREYRLAQFHFHAPSEHWAAGKAFDMELHLVHKNDKGELAVVGVFIKKGKTHSALEKIWGHLPDEVDKEAVVKTVSINARDLLPAAGTRFSYSGSLTTPPCSEGVSWHVLSTPVEVSGEQIEAFKKRVHFNARPVNPLNQRKVLLGK